MAAPAAGDGDDATVAELQLLALLQQREEQVQRLINTVQKDRQEIALLRDRFARLVQAARHFAKMGAVLTLRSVRGGGTKAALASGERRGAHRARLGSSATPPAPRDRSHRNPSTHHHPPHVTEGDAARIGRVRPSPYYPPHPRSSPLPHSLHLLENRFAHCRGPRRRCICARQARDVRRRSAGRAISDGAAAGGWGGGRRGGGGGVGAVTTRVGGIGRRVARRSERQ